jgi:hypothetical protein
MLETLITLVVIGAIVAWLFGPRNGHGGRPGAHRGGANHHRQRRGCNCHRHNGRKW